MQPMLTVIDSCLVFYSNKANIHINPCIKYAGKQYSVLQALSYLYNSILIKKSAKTENNLCKHNRKMVFLQLQLNLINITRCKLPP